MRKLGGAKNPLPSLMSDHLRNHPASSVYVCAQWGLSKLIDVLRESGGVGPLRTEIGELEA